VDFIFLKWLQQMRAFVDCAQTHRRIS